MDSKKKKKKLIQDVFFSGDWLEMGVFPWGLGLVRKAKIYKMNKRLDPRVKLGHITVSISHRVKRCDKPGQKQSYKEIERQALK